ncbi:FecR family protein [Pedobacter sp. ok626]|uniref:FecR family protein n=1 Tax=Pedobacter sp. ok626 TaxID=1761882 RepID=UPI00088340D2|nr:FecR family protein [Pedobacter sp. ok626]SDJ91378.1 FecR family protein [Pedobacter sp. ok626]
MVNQEHLNALIKQFTDGTISKDDYVELMAHFKSDKEADEVFLAMDKAWMSESIDRAHSPEEMDVLYYKLTSNKGFNKVPKVKLWPKIAIAASVAIALSTGIWFFVAHQRMINVQSQMVNNNNISPGHNQATLILSNGKHINLSDTKTGVVIDAARLSYNDGTEIKESKPTSLLTITTPNGGTYEIRLSDGTKVWLNATSTIKFPSTFTKSKYRKVELTGEAYFEVEKDKKMPFIVVTRGQEVEVLGTHFNINSYPDEASTKTTLLEGSVKVSVINAKTLHQASPSILKPGMQFIFTSSGVRIQELKDPEEAISWKSGYFTFNREYLDEVMRKVSRWYNVDIVYKNEQIKLIPFSGTITRFTNVSEVLKMLELTGKVKFTIEGKNIIADRK